MGYYLGLQLSVARRWATTSGPTSDCHRPVSHNRLQEAEVVFYTLLPLSHVWSLIATLPLPKSGVWVAQGRVPPVYVPHAFPHHSGLILPHLPFPMSLPVIGKLDIPNDWILLKEL